jgi:hypothetical protein
MQVSSEEKGMKRKRKESATLAPAETKAGDREAQAGKGKVNEEANEEEKKKKKKKVVKPAAKAPTENGVLVPPPPKSTTPVGVSGTDM